MKLFYVLFLFLFLFKCDNGKQKEAEKQKIDKTLNCDDTLQKEINKKGVILTLTHIDTTELLLCITNYLEEKIILNEFIISTSVFTLEIQDNEGNIKKIRGTPPPMFPDNLDDYNIVLYSKETIDIPLSLSIFENYHQKSIKIRAKVTFLNQEKEEKTTYSNWVIYKTE